LEEEVKIMTENKDNIVQQFTVGSWKQEDIAIIHQKLEVPNWAPWLAASKISMVGRCLVFPEGQLVVKDVQGVPLASLSMNKINWDGDSESLPSWDDVAGDPTTYERTYISNGNTLALMSMNVNPEYQGAGYARMLIEKAKLLAQELGVENLIGSFRPNEYGNHKAIYGTKALGFEKYASFKRDDGLPIDAWLRNLTRNGMMPLKVDHHAMTVTVTLDELAVYAKTYKLDMWKEVSPNVWECGEVGSWHIDTVRGVATYLESNLWGIIWVKPGLQ
jgi:GNAT superfamily N-acetyltransferase